MPAASLSKWGRKGLGICAADPLRGEQQPWHLTGAIAWELWCRAVRGRRPLGGVHIPQALAAGFGGWQYPP